MENVEIGYFVFLDAVEYVNTYQHFANFDLFRVVKDLNTGEILLLDEVDPVVCGFIANNENSLLKALIEAKRTLTMLLFNSIDDSAQSLVCTKAQDLASIAGGKKYHYFYKHILGCFD